MTLSRIDAQSQNYIINGAIDYSQYIGNQPSVLTASNDHYFDRFITKYIGNWSAAPDLIRQDVTVPGQARLSRAMKFYTPTATDATAGIVIEQRVEGILAKDLMNESFSLGFFGMSNLFQSVDIELFTPSTEDDFSAVTGLVALETIAIPTDSSWVNITKENVPTLTEPKNGLSVRLTFKDPIDFVTPLDFQATGFKINRGQKATEFSYNGRDAIEELVKCERYFEKSYDVDVALSDVTTVGAPESRTLTQTSTGAFTFTIPFIVTKRTIPTVIPYAPQSGTTNAIRNISQNIDHISGFNISDTSKSSFYIENNFALIDGQYYAFHWSAKAEL